jgi:hypothetical protein
MCTLPQLENHCFKIFFFFFPCSHGDKISVSNIAAFYLVLIGA